MRSHDRNVTNHSTGQRLTFSGMNVEGVSGGIKVTLTATVAGANSGHVCIDCARRVVAEGYEVQPT